MPQLDRRRCAIPTYADPRAGALLRRQLIKLETLDDFRRAVGVGTGVIAIRDPAVTKVHEPGCRIGLQQRHFLAKTARAKGSTGYYWAPTVDVVRARWPGARGCRVCGS